MSAVSILLLVVGLLMWAAMIRLALSVERNERRDVDVGLALALVRLYARVVHRVRYEGEKNLPGWRVREAIDAAGPDGAVCGPGPLVVVANHSAGIDPMLLQAGVEFEIRWMMLSTMMLSEFEWLWRFTRVIPVGGSVPGATSARQAIAHLQAGGVVGVFPEGAIERPARRLMPFEPGVGMLVTKTGARVLLAIIEGTPETRSAYASLLTPSRSRVRFLPMRDYAGSGLGAKEIAADVRAVMERETGWTRQEPTSGTSDRPFPEGGGGGWAHET